MTHIWLVTWTAPSHYLNQCCNIVNWTLGNKLQWNLNQNSYNFIHENAFENVVRKLAAILSQPQCVYQTYWTYHPDAFPDSSLPLAFLRNEKHWSHFIPQTHRGPWFNMKMSSYQYRKSHCGDKTVVRSSYLHNGNSYTGKTASS